MSGREGEYLPAETHQVLGLAGEDDGAFPVVAVEQGTDADGIPGGDELPLLSVVDHHGELRVQLGEHVQPVFPVEGKDDLAVRAALKLIPVVLQLFFQGAEQVELSVADAHVLPQMEGLHALLMEAHDGKPVEAEAAFPRRFDAGHIRSPGEGAVKVLPQFLFLQGPFGKAHDGTHFFQLLYREWIFRSKRFFSPVPGTAVG